MQSDHRRRTSGQVQPSDARRARTLAVALTALLLGVALYANNVQAAASGTKHSASQPRTFTVDAAAARANAPARDADLQHAAASPSTFPMDSHGFPMLTVTAPATGRENVPAPSRGAAPTVTAWTSPGVSSSARHH